MSVKRLIKASIFVLSLATGLAGVELFAQSPAAKPPLPSGPLLANPDSAQWQVKIIDARKAPSQPSKDAPKPTIVKVTKTKNIRFEDIEQPDGGRVIKWCDGNLQFIQTPGDPEPILFSAPDLTNPYYVSYAKSPFPDFLWISAKNYTGIQKVGGRDCLVFGDDVQNTSESLAKDVEAEASLLGKKADSKTFASPVAAYIDLETRLPVIYRKGDELHVYQFLASPEARLALPSNLEALKKLDEQRKKDYERKPARS